MNKFVNLHLIATVKHFLARINDELDLAHKIGINLLQFLVLLMRINAMIVTAPRLSLQIAMKEKKMFDEFLYKMFKEFPYKIF